MSRRIHKLLVANRGEIARRIFRTARDMGIETVAVHSDADADMPFVRDADEAVGIGPAPSAESYLRIERIVDAATRLGVDAIHPGYGFLAENAEFASAVEAAGLIFVGPSADAIRAMGSKREAKGTVSAAGVPVVPGYDGADQAPAVLAEQARAIGFPVLLKASAGGGGKGMKRVEANKELEEAIASAKREAAQAFGDDTLIIEKYIERPRHVEIQILGDHHGNVVHLFERECSIQRRHQKILEETPSPALDAELRAAMGAAAVQVASSIGYRNAGTVEFILASDGAFYFLEVNTRLQVEHPITELVTGLDLVREQIRVAEGHPLGFSQDEVRFEGAALEARIYAEDPEQGFLPQSGVVADWHFGHTPEGLRVDAGIETGSVVGIHYDPMLAKVITSGQDRDEALRRMRLALRGLSVQGVRTNRAFLLRVLDHPAYVAGDLHTHFIDQHLAAASETDPEGLRWSAIMAALHDHEIRRAGHTLAVPSGFRNNPRVGQTLDLAAGESTVRVEYRHRHRTPGTFDVQVDDNEFVVETLDQSGPRLTLRIDGRRVVGRVIGDQTRRHVHIASRGQSTSFDVVPRFPDRVREVPAGGCIAPMPGKIVSLRAKEGASVTAGQVLVVLEAMKMEHAVTAPHDGTLTKVAVLEGDQVEADALLAVVEPAE